MRRAKKVIWWLGGGIGTVLLLLICLELLLPRLINIEYAKEKIVDEIHRAAGCEAQFQSLDASFFPRPRIVIHQGSFSHPGEFSATVESLTVMPRILPLFAGNVQIARLKAVTPQVTVNLPEKKAKEQATDHKGIIEKKEADLFLEEMKKEAARIIALIRSKDSGLVLVVKSGKLTLSPESGPSFLVHDINGRVSLSPGKIKLNIASKSNLFEKFSVNGWLDTNDLTSKGRITLVDLRPQEPAAYLLPSAQLHIGEMSASMDLIFSGKGTEVFQADLKGSMPSFTFEVDGETFSLKGAALTGSFNLSAGKFAFSLASLAMESPRLRLAGDLLLDSNAPLVSLNMEGKDLDVAPARSVVLALYGKNHTVEKIFDIVRGGRVPSISYSAQGTSFFDLGKPDNYVIKGNMSEGVIFVPDAELEVHQAQGEVIISHGILEGRKLEGKTGNSEGSDGTLTIGLRRSESGDAPFHLDIALDADLAELPPVLERVVKNLSFQRELALIKNVKGNAVGRLLLGERLKSVDVRVEAREFSLHSNYERVPYPIGLDGESFLYEGTRITAESLSANVGKSSISKASASLGWGEDSHLQVVSNATGSISLDEIYPWLTSYKGVKNPFKNLKSIKGTLALSALNLNGPLLKPDDWLLHVKGTVEDLNIDSTLFPDRISVKNGSLDATGGSLSLTNWNTIILDASLLISGSFLIGQDPRIDFTLDGSIGPQANQHISELIRLPPEVRLRSPISLTKSRLTWQRNQKSTFSGEISIPGAPMLSMDVSGTPEAISIERLTIKDDISNASLSMEIKDREPDFAFKGTLDSKSLDNLLEKNQLLSGWMKGDFKAHISLDRPMDSIATGQLQLSGFQYPWGLKTPVLVETASLEAAQNKLLLRPAILNVEGTQMSLEGTVEAIPDGLRLDVDLSAGSLDWSRLEMIAENLKEEEEKPGNGGAQSASSRALSSPGALLQGVVRVKAEEFTYDKFTWSPIRAAVFLRQDETRIEIAEANICGISTPGTIVVSDRGVQIAMNPAARDQELDPVLTCFFNKQKLMDGTFSLKGEINSEKADEAFLKSLKGNIEFNARKGRMYRFGLVSKIISLLNVTEIYRGQLPDLIREGCAYDSIKAKGSIEGGKLIIEETTVDGPCMKMVWHGEVDLEKNRVDLTVLVAPLRTVDTIIGAIPLLGGLLNGTLVSIPVRVSGDLADPEVRPLSPSAVGSELLDFMKRTIKAPFKILQPLW